MTSLAARLGWSAYVAAHAPGQTRFPFAGEATIVRAQSRRVRAAVAHAYRTVPYYRELMRARGLAPEDFRRVGDLAKLPLLDRGQVQRDPEYFVSTAQPLSRYRRVASSGSTGAPLTAYWDWPAHFRSAAYALRGRPAWVRHLGSRQTVISPPGASVRAGQDFNRRTAMVGGLVRRQNLSMLDPPEVNVELINDFRPQVIGSYGSYLDDLFLYLERSGARMHRPALVGYGADDLPSRAREAIAKRGIGLAGAYQAVEVLNIGFECGRGTGLHLNVDLCPVTILGPDGAPCEVGEPGEVVVSNLVNRATVLLNYRLGDLASRLPERCPCGRTLPLLSPVEGRSDDWVQRSDGARVHPQSVCQCFRGESGVWRYQVVQPERGRLEVAVVPAPGADAAAIEARVRDRLAAVIGDGTAVAVRFVDEIPAAASGKRRAVRSHLGRVSAEAR